MTGPRLRLGRIAGTPVFMAYALRLASALLLFFFSPDSVVARLLESPAFARSGVGVVRDGDGAGRSIGLVSRTDVQRAIRARRVGCSAGPRAA
jgi:hypothetical protein